MMMSLLLVASAYASPSAFDDARRMLTSILDEKNSAGSLCWESDDNDAVVLVAVSADSTREPIAGPRGPTLNDTLAMLPEGSPWYGVDPSTVEQCPAAAVVG